MIKYVVMIIGCLILFAGGVRSQEVAVTDFPLGVAGNVGVDFFKPYYNDLKAIAATLHRYPLAYATVTGSADGEQFRQNNDALNPGLALGRAHALRNFLIAEFGVDSTQLIVQSKDVKATGAAYRCATVRIVRDLSDLDSRLEAVEKRPPVEKHFTEIKEVVASPAENLGLQFSLGFSSSPFGGIPIASGAVAWKRIVYVEGVVGHTFWNNSFMFESVSLDTKRRLVGGQVIVYPDENLPVGIVGGWMRIEEISVKYYEYVKLSEGPMLGLRVNPLNFLSLTGVYNPSRQRVAGNTFSKAKNGQFLLSVTAFMEIGGEK